MARPRFKKFVRPEAPRAGSISERDLDIIEAVLRYRFSPTSELVRLVGGNEDVTHRRLRGLWERGLVSRFAFPGVRTHSEFYYYLDSDEALNLLGEQCGLQIQPQMREEIRNNRAKDYATAALRGEYMKLGFLKHSLMVSRMHFVLETACRSSKGAVMLEAWAQGGELAGHKVEVPRLRSSRNGNEYFWEETDHSELLPVEPDGLCTLRFADRPAAHQLAHFLYEADRGTMTTTDMLRKLRAYYHFIKKRQLHKEAFGIHPVRAVLVETTDEARARRLMELAGHPLVAGPRAYKCGHCGQPVEQQPGRDSGVWQIHCQRCDGRSQTKPLGLFWFTISSLLTDQIEGTGKPAYLLRPELVFDSIWALPDRTLRGLKDSENSTALR